MVRTLLLQSFIYTLIIISSGQLYGQYTDIQLRNNVKQQLDSIILISNVSYDNMTEDWVIGSKKEYIYDSNENYTSFITYGWNHISEQWENSSFSNREEYSYDVSGNVTQVLFYSWASEQWRMYVKHDNEYDINNNQTSHTISLWHPYDMLWINLSKDEYTYDNEGNNIYFAHLEWESNTSEWVYEYYHAYTYNNENQLLSSTLHFWNQGTQEWEPSSNAEYSYDANGNNILIELSFWVADSQEWEISRRTEIIYDDVENSVERFIYEWNNQSEQWGGYFAYSTTFDTYENITEIAYYNWNNSTQEWVYDYKYQYNYDADGIDVQQQIIYDWNNNTQEWLNRIKSEYQYDSLYTPDELILPSLDVNFLGKRVMHTRYEWNEDIQQWNARSRGHYHYSEKTITGLENILKTNIHIFPNPTNDLLNFDLENTHSAIINIHDMQGKHIRTQALAQDNQLSVRHLNSGVYFYQLQHDGEVFGGKFIVK